MTSAYIVAVIDEHDGNTFEEYRRVALPVIAEFGGRSLLQGTQHEVLEGDWSPRRVVVVEFPSLQQARAWYSSAAYQSARKLRLASADTRMLLFEGRAQGVEDTQSVPKTA
jgi:uncharacterized protein (DUF1330 family)